MNLSFYTAGTGATAQQHKLDVIANNLSNVNTVGFKGKHGSFSDLIYKNVHDPAGQPSNLKVGVGVKMEKADTNFSSGTLTETGQPLDFMVVGSGFFGLLDPVTGQRSYTRDGNFYTAQQANGEFLLTNRNGKLVVDPQGNPIPVVNVNDPMPLGVFDFLQTNGMQNIGFNEYVPIDKNGQPIVRTGEGIVVRGALEESNVDIGTEFARMIESQRGYQYAIRMIQTSDEVQTTINSLR